MGLMMGSGAARADIAFLSSCLIQYIIPSTIKYLKRRKQSVPILA